MPKFLDLTGIKFGRLTVIEQAENQGKRICWKCQCDCKNELVVRSCYLTSATTKSCGCLLSEPRPTRIKDHSTRVCSICKRKLSISCFSGFNREKGHYTSKCKECAKDYKKKKYQMNIEYREETKKIARKYSKEHRKPSEIRRKEHLLYDYGLTMDDYYNLLTKQNNCCALCKTDKLGRKSSLYWAVDHCHETGRVRGLLCLPCNTKLGMYESLMKQIGEDTVKEYLRSNDTHTSDLVNALELAT